MSEYKDKRCTDQERSAAVDALSRAMADGQLTLTEFDERSGQAHAATQRSELVDLLDDLVDEPAGLLFGPGAGTAVAHRAPSDVEWATHQVSDAQRHREMVLARSRSLVTGGGSETGFSLAIFGGVTKAAWQVPKAHWNFNIFGGSDFDLRDCRFSGPVTTLWLNSCFGGADVLVPEGVRVDMGGLAIFGGNELVVENGAIHPNSLPEDAPLLLIRGLSIFGGTNVKVVRG